MNEQDILEKNSQETKEIPVQELLPMVKWDTLEPKEKEFKTKYYYKVFNYITYIGKLKNKPVITIKSFCSYDAVYIKVILHDEENNLNNKEYAKLLGIIKAKVTRKWEWVIVDGTYIFIAKISSFKCFGLYTLLKNVKQNIIYQEILKFVLQACDFTNINYSMEPYACTWITTDSLKVYYKLKKESQESKQANYKHKYRHTYEDDDDTEYPT